MVQLALAAQFPTAVSLRAESASRPAVLEAVSVFCTRVRTSSTSGGAALAGLADGLRAHGASDSDIEVTVLYLGVHWASTNTSSLVTPSPSQTHSRDRVTAAHRLVVLDMALADIDEASAVTGVATHSNRAWDSG